MLRFKHGPYCVAGEDYVVGVHMARDCGTLWAWSLDLPECGVSATHWPNLLFEMKCALGFHFEERRKRDEPPLAGKGLRYHLPTIARLLGPENMVASIRPEEILAPAQVSARRQRIERKNRQGGIIDPVWAFYDSRLTRAFSGLREGSVAGEVPISALQSQSQISLGDVHSWIRGQSLNRLIVPVRGQWGQASDDERAGVIFMEGFPYLRVRLYTAEDRKKEEDRRPPGWPRFAEAPRARIKGKTQAKDI
jgi:hypothetical protein